MEMGANLSISAWDVAVGIADEEKRPPVHEPLDDGTLSPILCYSFLYTIGT